MKTNNNSRFTILFFLVAALIALASRWLPHPDNFSAMGGLIFLCGYIFRRNKLVLPLALAALVISDLLIGLYPGIEWTYLGYLLVLAAGLVVRKAVVQPQIASVLTISTANIFAAVAFFAVSNFGVWFASGLYQPTLDGFIQCYLMALPFLHMTLISQVVVGVVFVLTYSCMVIRGEAIARQRV